MGKVEERRLRVLQLLYEHPLALPKRTIYHNLRREYNLTFGEDTTATRINELVEMGLIDQFDIGNGYYAINDDGIEYFKNNKDKLEIG